MEPIPVLLTALLFVPLSNLGAAEAPRMPVLNPPQVLDEGLYLDVPAAEVAYNVQIVRLDSGGYATVYHSEPRKAPGLPGDAVKAALQTGEFAFAMPPQRHFAIPNDTEDTESALYSPCSFIKTLRPRCHEMVAVAFWMR